MYVCLYVFIYGQGVGSADMDYDDYDDEEEEEEEGGEEEQDVLQNNDTLNVFTVSANEFLLLKNKNKIDGDAKTFSKKSETEIPGTCGSTYVCMYVCTYLDVLAA